MLLAFVGDDTLSARAALRTAVARLQEEVPGANFVKFDDQNFNQEAALEAFVEGNLFAPKNIIIFDDILSHPDGEAFYSKQDLTSDHIILVREIAPKKPLLTKIEKFGAVSVFSLPKKEKKNDFSAFALADAAMVRDRKTAWVEFEKSRRKGEAMEALHGMLFWAFKTLTAVATLPKADALASGIKANSYASGLRGMERYKPAEICARLDDLKDMYHRAHRGECDLEYSLEQFLLQL